MIFGHTHGSRDGNISLLFGPLVGLPLWSRPNFCVYCQVFSDISSGTTMRFIFMVLREMSRPLLNGCHEIRCKHVPIRMICSNFGTPLNFLTLTLTLYFNVARALVSDQIHAKQMKFPSSNYVYFVLSAI